MKYIGLILLLPVIGVFIALSKKGMEEEARLRQTVNTEIQQQADKLAAVVEQNKRETDAMRLELLQQDRGLAALRIDLGRVKAEVERLESEKNRLVAISESMRQQSGEISKNQTAVVSERESVFRDRSVLEGEITVLEGGLGTLTDAKAK